MRKCLGWVVMATLMLTLGCSTATCPMDTEVTCNYQFYDADGNASALYDTLTVTFRKLVTIYTYSKEGMNDSIVRDKDTTLVAAGYTETEGKTLIDTIIMNRLIEGTEMKLPMSYYALVDTLVFHYGKIRLPDTLYIYHTNYTHVETPECGSYQFHNISNLRATDRCIDRVELIDPKVNYDKKDNVKIYFNTSPE